MSDKIYEDEVSIVSPGKIVRDWEKLEIDYDKLVKFLSLGMNRSDVAYAMGCSVSALERRVAEDWVKEGYLYGDLERWYRGMYIRQVVLKGQIKAAEEGDWRALEWLGKNYLGQSIDGVKEAGKELALLKGSSVKQLIDVATKGIGKERKQDE
jgi:hypothetical protein